MSSQGLAIDAANNFVFVTFADGAGSLDKIVKWNANTGTAQTPLTDTPGAQDEATGVAYNPVNGKLYVTFTGQAGGGGDALGILDGDSAGILSTQSGSPVSTGDMPVDVAVRDTTNYFTGLGDGTNWSDGANWSHGVTPDGTTNVLIPSGPSVGLPLVTV